LHLVAEGPKHFASPSVANFSYTTYVSTLQRTIRDRPFNTVLSNVTFRQRHPRLRHQIEVVFTKTRNYEREIKCLLTVAAAQVGSLEAVEMALVVLTSWYTVHIW